MITFMKGEVTQISQDPPRIVVLTSGGVGYLVNLPIFVYERMARQDLKIGDDVDLHIFYSVSERQPLPMLVGFQRPEDRAFFEQFIQVEGIGPAKATSALILPISDIARAIETEDTVALTSMPGIGTRAAQKIVATLRGKVADVIAHTEEEDTEQTAPIQTDIRSDVVGVLTGLGYRAPEAQRLVNEAMRRNPEISDDTQALLQEIFRYNAAARL